MYRQVVLALMSDWRSKPLQLAMLLLGLALATALWSAVQAINGEARASYARAAAVVGQDRLSALARPDGAAFGQAVFVALRRAGWLVSPLIEGEKRYGDVRLRILGVDLLSLPPEAAQVEVAERDGGLLAYITPPGLAFVSPETAGRLAGQATPPLRVSDGIPPGTAVMDIGIAQSLLSAEGRVSRLILWPDQPARRLPLSQAAPELVVETPDTESDLARLTDSFHLNLTAFSFLAFAVGLFIVRSATGLAFERRRPMLRTLRALGVPARGLLLVILFELLGLSAFAGAMGVVLGYGMASLLLPDVAATLRGLYGAEIAGSLTIRPSVWIAGMAIAAAGTIAASAGSLAQVWRLPLLAPAQPRAWTIASEKAMGAQAAAALVLLLAAWLLAAFGSGLSAGFAVLAALLLGAALLLPLVLSSLLKLGQRLSRGVVAQWFWADTRQQLPGLSLALMALMLALATNVGVGTMVSSFRHTFVGWLDQRLASELYVTARSEAEAVAMRDWLGPRSQAVLPVWNAEGTVLGQPVQIYGMADHATYRDNWPLLQASPDVWEQVASSRAVLVNEQFARRQSLSLGNVLTVPGGLRLPVAGVFSDYGNPKGQLIVSIPLLTRLFPDVPKLRFAIRAPPDKAADLAERLRAEFDLPAANVVDRAGIKAFSLRIFDRTFTVTAALNALTLGVAALALLSSLLTLSAMRLPQLAPVWASGVTRVTLARLELVRSVALTAFTMIVALPVGIGLAWVLLAVVNVEAFGWRLPLRLFPLDWLWLAAMAVMASALAALLPALRLVRMTPAELLGVFTHER